jgi:hypothetical protein
MQIRILLFVIDLQDANKKIIEKKFFCLLLFEGTFTSFLQDKKSKRCHKAVGIKVFLTICLVIEESGSIPLNNGSGSGSRRPKNIRIRWIRIRIRIHNTASKFNFIPPQGGSVPPPQCSQGWILLRSGESRFLQFVTVSLLNIV